MDGLLASDDRFLKARFLARAAKGAHLRGFAGDRNVIGAAFGRRIVNDRFTDEPALVVYVMRKVPKESLPPSRLLPRRVYIGGDQLEVDILETGPIYPLSFTARERPAPQGVSIAHTAVTAGTLGAVVSDNTDGSVCVLSNNHVMANENAAAIGDPIVQPGPADGGVSPADDIATLKRFVTINATGNTVDGAIAQVKIPGVDVIDAVKDGLMPVANSDHPAVGLLFAGSCKRTIMNPISDVMAQLNISFPAAGATAAADIGMNVEKVGRTTEYTTSTITEMDLTVTIDYGFGPATFDRQLATAWMSDPGDSGSVICSGGSGGSEDHCGCGTTSTAETLLGVDLSLDEAVEKEFRERHLQHTRVGRYLIDLFFQNEARLVSRARRTKVGDDDRAFGQYLYEKYVDDARAAALRPDASGLRLTEEHLRDARDALGRVRQYLTDDEVYAAEEVFKIAHQAVGRTVPEFLRMLNDEALYRRVRELVARIAFLEEPKHVQPRDDERAD